MHVMHALLRVVELPLLEVALPLLDEVLPPLEEPELDPVPPSEMQLPVATC
jgi:hypothetical protein